MRDIFSHFFNALKGASTGPMVRRGESLI